MSSTTAEGAQAALGIRDVVFHPEIWRSGHGDNWPLTWAEDDCQYTLLGDGKGWGETTYNLRAWRLAGGPTDFQAEDLPGLPTYPAPPYRWYGYAILAAGGVLYAFIAFFEERRLPGWTQGKKFPVGAKLLYSPDRGASWFRHDGADDSVNRDVADPTTMFFWNEPDLAFSWPSFLQQGQDHALAFDEYVYVYAPNGPNDLEHLLLARVPQTDVTNRAAWEFFVSRDGKGRPRWSRDIRERGAVHSFPTGWVSDDYPMSWHPSVVYNPGLRLYLMAAYGRGKGGTRQDALPTSLGLYAARRPWGPWSQIKWVEEWVVDDPGNRLYEPVIAPKWISQHGRTIYLVCSNSRDQWKTDYRFIVQKVELKLSEAQAGEDSDVA